MDSNSKVRSVLLFNNLFDVSEGNITTSDFRCSGSASWRPLVLKPSDLYNNKITRQVHFKVLYSPRKYES